MEIFENAKGQWSIIHADKIVRQKFDTEAAAWTWADQNIDDQVFDNPNCLAPPLEYDGPGGAA